MKSVSDANDRYFEPDIECMARAELEALQEARLLELLPYVHERSGLVATTWAEAGVHPRDVKSLDDFYERAPIIDKDTLRRYRDDHNDPFSGLVVDRQETWAAGTTSGTTGDPTVIPYVGRVRGREEPATYLSSFARSFWELGVRPGDFVTLNHFTSRGPVFTNAQRIGAVPMVFSHDPRQMARFCRLSLEFRPALMYVMSMALLLELLRLESEEEVDIRDVLSSHAVIWGGEPIGNLAREALRRWEAEVFENTSVGDVTLATECREHAGAHFAEDTALAEYHDVDLRKPADDGRRAELIVTSLDPAFPLLRYRSDDVVTVDRSTCGCGRTHARLRTVGRVSDSFSVRGRAVLPLEVWSAVEAVTESSKGLFQIVAPDRALEALRLRVGVDASSRSADEVANAIAESVEQAVGVLPQVELVAVADLLKLGPPHKIPRVVKA
ncbi:MAG: phenylacetate-CoA ligase [Acidimicrobiaceae bacterium]